MQQSKSTHVNRVDIATIIEGAMIHVKIIEGNDDDEYDEYLP